MRAIAFSQFGGPEVLTAMEWPTPSPGPGEVLVRVQAAAVTPLDGRVRRGTHETGLPLPLIPGTDGAGIVEAVGAGVNRLRVGDAVLYSSESSGQGSCAEYQVVAARQVALKPGRLSFAEAAALPTAGLTAWQALFTRGALRTDETVLIHGGAGGVGSVAIQLAKWAQARVFTTASPQNRDFVRALGADVVIDYTTERFETAVQELTGGKGAELVLDTVGGETLTRSLVALADHGRLVSIAAGDEPRSLLHAWFKNATVHFLLMERQREILERVASLAASGMVRPVVGTVLPLEAAAEAHRQIEAGHGRGRIVLIPGL